MPRIHHGLGIAGISLFCLLQPAPAAACGGTFCDAGPQPMPVDQTGENILFVMDGEYVEAHVQIQYQGEAERFAWVVPMQAEPEVTVGSQLLFDSLLNFSVPTYFTTTQFESCGNASTTAAFTASSATTTTGGVGGTGGGGGPEILFQETVGSFDVTVLKGGDATEVTDWLIENDYELAPEAPAILQDYVNLDYVFAAIKLTAGADVDEIHPLVFRYPGTEPCVPLKLTAVAATDDMAVRAFFLGEDRVYPTNYKHVEFNPVRLDWALQGTNYTSVVSHAVDEDVADGQAFITEYAGTSSGVPTANIFNTNWDADALRGLDATQIVSELNTQGVMYCTVYQCNFTHPLLLPLLRKYLPPPDGWTDVEFYMCLATGGQSATTSGVDDTCLLEADGIQFDSNAFADDYDAEIVQPGQHAVDLLTEWPYLTRLFTTISPDEMTQDPTFRASPQLSLGVSQSRQATQYVQCSGDRSVTLPDDRVVALDGSTWPAFSSAMPWAERIEELQDDGTLLTLVDNSAVIDEQLAAWNELSGVDVGSGGASASGANSSGANSSGANGSGANGSGANGSGANGSGGNSSDGNGSGGKASGSKSASSAGGAAGADSIDDGGIRRASGGGGCSFQAPAGGRENTFVLVSLLGLATLRSRRRRRRA